MSENLPAKAEQNEVGWRRTDQDMVVDQSWVMDLYYVKRRTKTEVVRELEYRAGVEYRYTWSMLDTDLAAIESRVYSERGMEEVRRDIELQDTRLAAVEREAWAAWERSQDPARREKVIERLYEWESETGEKKRELIRAEIEKMVITRVGEGQWLKILLDAIEKRSKLRQLYKTRIEMQIDSQHTERRLEYHVVHPGLWRDDAAAKKVIEAADDRLIEQMGDDALDLLMPRVGRNDNGQEQRDSETA